MKAGYIASENGIPGIGTADTSAPSSQAPHLLIPALPQGA